MRLNSIGCSLDSMTLHCHKYSLMCLPSCFCVCSCIPLSFEKPFFIVTITSKPTLSYSSTVAYPNFDQSPTLILFDSRRLPVYKVSALPEVAQAPSHPFQWLAALLLLHFVFSMRGPLPLRLSKTVACGPSSWKCNPTQRQASSPPCLWHLASLMLQHILLKFTDLLINLLPRFLWFSKLWLELLQSNAHTRACIGFRHSNYRWQ